MRTAVKTKQIQILIKEKYVDMDVNVVRCASCSAAPVLFVYWGEKPKKMSIKCRSCKFMHSF